MQIKVISGDNSATVAEIAKQAGIDGAENFVDAATLANDIAGDDAFRGGDSEKGRDMIITPREIDLVISRAAKLVALTVNKALQPHITADEMLMLVTSS